MSTKASFFLRVLLCLANLKIGFDSLAGAREKERNTQVFSRYNGRPYPK